MKFLQFQCMLITFQISYLQSKFIEYLLGFRKHQLSKNNHQTLINYEIHHFFVFVRLFLTSFTCESRSFKSPIANNIFYSSVFLEIVPKIFLCEILMWWFLNFTTISYLVVCFFQIHFEKVWFYPNFLFFL